MKHSTTSLAIHLCHLHHYTTEAAHGDTYCSEQGPQLESGTNLQGKKKIEIQKITDTWEASFTVYGQHTFILCTHICRHAWLPTHRHIDIRAGRLSYTHTQIQSLLTNTNTWMLAWTKHLSAVFCLWRHWVVECSPASRHCGAKGATSLALFYLIIRISLANSAL